MSDGAGVSLGANLTSLQLAAWLENRIVKQWFELTLPSALCAVDDDTQIPDPCAKSSLYDAMADVAMEKSRDDHGVMYLYCGPEFSGKTVAAKQLIRRLQCAKGDSYPSLYVDSTFGNLYACIREKLKVPSLITDTQWSALLFATLSNTAPEINTSRWWNFDCGADAASPHYQNTAGFLPPVIVIDQLATLDFNDYVQLQKFYQLAHVHRVLVFVITDDEDVARYIAGMNGDKRVTPLPGRHTREQYKIMKDPENKFGKIGIKVVQGLVWIHEEWTRQEQHEYLLNFFQEQAKEAHLGPDGYFTFLVRGENPSQAMQRAMKYFAPAEIDRFEK